MVKTVVLPNGVTCVCEERPGSGFVAMQVYLNKGGAKESAEENGLTNLTQEACFGGTKTRSRDQISEASESNGGRLGSTTNADATNFQAMALTQNAETTFAVLADVIRHPAFAPEEIDRARAQISQGIVAENQDPQRRASKAFFETAFDGQAVGRNADGTPELLASFTPEQVRKKHEEMLANPSGIVISFAGDIGLAKAEELAQKYFGDIPAATPEKKVSVAFTGGDTRTPEDIDQLKLYVGFPAPGLNSDDRFAMNMLENLLAGGMSTPIFQEFREKRGLVYTAGAKYVPFDDGGTFLIVSGSGEGKAGEIMHVTFDILKKVMHEGFTQKEMDEARERILRMADGGREKSMSSGSINAGQILSKGRTSTRDELEAHLKEVTNDDLRRVCFNMLKDNQYALSAVGPLDTLPAEAEIKTLMKQAVDGFQTPATHQVASAIAAFSRAAAPPQKKEDVKPQITVLENGMTIVTIERPGPMSCGAWVGVGSDNETIKLWGATHMNEHMMFRGTPLYGPGTIDRVVEGELAGQLNAYTTKDKTCYYFYNLAPDALKKVVEICGQMVFFADIAEKEYEGVPGVDKAGKPVRKGSEQDAVFEEMRMCNDDVGNVVMELMAELAYPDQPHGRSIIGTEESLKGVSAKDLREYRDDFYTPNNVIFCAAGPVKHEDFVAAVKEQYGHLKPGQVPNLPPVTWGGGTEVREAECAHLCNVMLAAPAVSRADPDAMAYDALTSLLGDGNSSALHRGIVDKLQLSPGIECGTMNYINGGTSVVIGMTPAENVKPMVNAMYGIMRDVIENLSEADLAKAKAILEASVRMGFETNQSISNTFACNVQAFGKLVTEEDICADIRKLTVADLKRVGEKMLAANPVAAMVVPPGTDPALLPSHQEVVAMRDGTWTPASAVPKPQGPGINPSAP